MIQLMNFHCSNSLNVQITIFKKHYYYRVVYDSEMYYVCSWPPPGWGKDGRTGIMA